MGLALVPGSGAAAAPGDAPTGYARGQVLQVDTSLTVPQPAPRTFAVRGDSSRSDSRIDGTGIDTGDYVADGFADGLRIDASPYGDDYLSTRYAASDTHSPSNEDSCVDDDDPDPGPACEEVTKVMAQAAQLLASSTMATDSVAEGSVSSGGARSFNKAQAQSLSLLPDAVSARPTVNVGLVSSQSETKGTGGEHAASSASSELAGVSITPLAGVLGDIKVIRASATASTNGPETATCAILDIGNTPVLPCTATVLNVPPGPLTPLTLAQISIAEPLNSDTTNSFSDDAGIVALTIRVFDVTTPAVLNDTVSVTRLGIAEAYAGTETPPPTDPGPCGTANPVEPASAGSAIASVVHARDGADLAEADGAISKARIDEANLAEEPDVTPAGLAVNPTDPRGPNTAEALGQLFEVEAFPAPSPGPPEFEDSTDIIRVIDSSADAPERDDFPGNDIEPESEATNIATVSAAVPPPPTNLLQLAAEEVTTTASAGPDEHAVATTSVQSAGAQVAGPAPTPQIDVGLEDVQSEASSHRNTNDVTSNAHTLLTQTDVTVGGIDVSATTVESEATAIADGGAGAADATATIVSLTVNGTNIAIPADTDGDGVPGPQTIDLGVAKVLIGENVVETASGAESHALVDPIVVQVPGGATPPEDASRVVIGHAEAHALYDSAASGPAALVVKSVDENFDPQNPDDLEFETNPSVVPHQKLWFHFCVANTGTTPLTNVKLVDQLDPRLMAVGEPPGPPSAFGFTQSGNTLTANLGTLSPGQEVQRKVLVEVRPDVAVTDPPQTIPNTATVTAAGGLNVVSNQVELIVEVKDDQPALDVIKRSEKCFTNEFPTRLRLELRLRNHAGASIAVDPRVDQMTVKHPPNLVLVTPLPITFADLPPGGFSNFAVDFHVVGLPGTPCPNKKLIIVREVAENPAGDTFAFD